MLIRNLIQWKARQFEKGHNLGSVWDGRNRDAFSELRMRPLLLFFDLLSFFESRMLLISYMAVSVNVIVNSS